MAVETFYFDGHDGSSDPDFDWSDDSRAYDGELDTVASCSTSGTKTTSELQIQGTTASLSTNATISLVRVRVHDGDVAGGGFGWGDYVTLDEPSGGWTSDDVLALECACYADIGGEETYVAVFEDGNMGGTELGTCSVSNPQYGYVSCVQIEITVTYPFAVSTAGSAFEYDTQAAFYHSTISIDSNHIFLSYRGNAGGGETDLYAGIFEVNTGTWEITTANSLLAFDSDSTTSLLQSILVDENHVVCVYKDAGTNMKAIPLEINTSTWAVTTAATALTFDTQASSSPDPACCMIDSNHFVAFWGGLDTDGYTQTFEVNTTTWAITTANSSLEFDTDNGTNNFCLQVDSNHFMNLWRGTTTDGFTQIFEINTSTWAITTSGSKFEFDTASYNEGSCFLIDANHVFVFFCGQTGYNEEPVSQVFEINTTTWTITTKNTEHPLTPDAPYQASGLRGISIDSTTALATSAETYDPLSAQIFSTDTSTGIVRAESPVFNFGTSYYGFGMSVTEIDPTHYIIFWEGESGDGFTQVLTFTESDGDSWLTGPTPLFRRT